jgi:cytoskeletal protein CcmA (bactofilin family)
MFLKLNRSRLVKKDDGMAMVAVIGLMSVGLLLTSLILGSIVGGMGFTSATVAGVQSQASAEAGIAAATVGLQSGTCTFVGGVYQSAEGESPAYVAKIYSADSAGNWTQSCPISGTTQIKIVAEGTAESLGVANQSGGDHTFVEARFENVAVPSTVLELGPAVYAYSSVGYSGSGTLIDPDGSGASVMVRTGNVTCNGGSSAAADLVVNNGDLSIVSGCVINGNVWASGKVTITGGTVVTGNIVASNVQISSGPNIGGSIWSSGPLSIANTTLQNGASVIANGATTLTGVNVPGSVYTTGKLTIDGSTPIGGNVIANEVVVNNSGGKVSGTIWSATSFTSTWSAMQNNIYAKDINLGGGNFTGLAVATNTFKQESWQTVNGSVKAKTIVNANITINGNADAVTFPNPTTVKGTRTNLTAAPTIPTAPPAAPVAAPSPMVPAWPDYTYQASDWGGYTFVTVAAPCGVAQFNAAIASLSGQKGVLDARACASPLTIGTCGGCDVNIVNDTAIFARAFNFGGSLAFKANTEQKLWFVTEDTVAGTSPSCTGTGVGNFVLGGGMTFSTKLEVMVYTPCQANIGSGIKMTGQIFAGSTAISGAAQISYRAVGLPGVDLSTGTSSSTTTPEATWTLQSTRNISG